jgi:transcriptional regulator with PAS, ATPase and Fis domain
MSKGQSSVNLLEIRLVSIAYRDSGLMILIGIWFAIYHVTVKNIYQILFSHNSRLSKIKTIIDDVARTDVSVLIKGESGTGKELVAKAIHLNSQRREKPFIKVNCAAIPQGLLESELFGFERGAFTGDCLKKPGKFELANEGTILFNDIGEMDVSVQAKLLQVLQDGEFSRLGGSGTLIVNTRVMSTTKDHLADAMLNGLFRRDLFYRVNVISITLPPLRDRKEQIIPFSQYFYKFYQAKYGRKLPPLSFKTLSTLKACDWPGNIRELEDIMKRIVLLGEEGIDLNDLTLEKRENQVSSEISSNFDASALEETDTFNLKEVGEKAAERAEKELIQSALRKTHWNRKKTARLLRVSYKALLNKIQKYHLDEIEDLQVI